MAAASKLRDGNVSGKRTRFCFAAVIKKAMLVKSMEQHVVLLEPILRKLMREEAEQAALKALQTFQQMYGLPATVARPQPQLLCLPITDGAVSPTVLSPSSRSTLRLSFVGKPPKYMFTGNQIRDEDGYPLKLQLVHEASSDGGEALHDLLPQSLKIELVIVNTDFPGPGKEEWAAEEFNDSVVKEREGYKPLLTGNVNNVFIKGGSVTLEDIVITDNSSWSRSKMFRIGARIAPKSIQAAGGVRIKEAITEAFKVKDKRGESNKKHYPPLLSDKVWRLEKISKDGKFHKRLSENNIKNVEDFLNLYTNNPELLRKIINMPENTLEITVKHTKTCKLETKFNQNSDACSTLPQNPICGVESDLFDGVCNEDQNMFCNAQWTGLNIVNMEENMTPKGMMHTLYEQSLITQAGIPQDSIQETLQNGVNVSSSRYHHHASPALGPSSSFDPDILVGHNNLASRECTA